MKHAFFLILITLVVITVSSCKEQTEFAEVTRQQAVKLDDQDQDNRCLEYSTNEAQCNAVVDCQGLYNNRNLFSTCIPLDNDPIEETPVTPTQPAEVEEEEEEVPGEEAPEEPEEEPEEEKSYCKNNKILVCHYPQGNFDNARTLCLNQNGFVNGHDDHHVGDHRGACRTVDLMGQ